MFHLCAYSQAVAATALTDLAAVTDPVLSQRNNHYVPGIPMSVMAAYGIGGILQNCQMLTPKIQAVTPNYLLPVRGAALPVRFDRPNNYMRKPFALNVGEELQFKVVNTAVTSTQTSALAWLRVSNDPAPQGETYHYRGTSTTAAVAYTWTTLSMTWANSLPMGTWAVVGGSYYATNAIAFRVVFPGVVWRPGALGFATEADASWSLQQEDGMGLWGAFPITTLPNIEVFNGGTDASHTVYLDLIKIG